MTKPKQLLAKYSPKLVDAFNKIVEACSANNRRSMNCINSTCKTIVKACFSISQHPPRHEIVQYARDIGATVDANPNIVPATGNTVAAALAIVCLHYPNQFIQHAAGYLALASIIVAVRLEQSKAKQELQKTNKDKSDLMSIIDRPQIAAVPQSVPKFGKGHRISHSVSLEFITSNDACLEGIVQGACDETSTLMRRYPKKSMLSIARPSTINRRDRQKQGLIGISVPEDLSNRESTATQFQNKNMVRRRTANKASKDSDTACVWQIQKAILNSKDRINQKTLQAAKTIFKATSQSCQRICQFVMSQNPKTMLLCGMAVTLTGIKYNDRPLVRAGASVTCPVICNQARSEWRLGVERIEKMSPSKEKRLSG